MFDQKTSEAMDRLAQQRGNRPSFRKGDTEVVLQLGAACPYLTISEGDNVALVYLERWLQEIITTGQSVAGYDDWGNPCTELRTELPGFPRENIPDLVREAVEFWING